MNKVPNCINAANCSIGIVTYLERFETYFQPLIKRLSFLFPDYDINVFINGHHDIVRQTRFLRDITAFLCPYPRIHYLTHMEHQPLARGWNWLILMSTHPWTLILNDDVYCDLEFRYHLEKLEDLPTIFTLNGSFSHFVINKEVISRVGWFDERFIGVGWEDGDMICRLAFHGIPLEDIVLRGLRNYGAEQKDAGWIKESGMIYKKYASVNLETFKKKWWHSHWSSVPQKGSFKITYHGDEWTVAPNNALGPMPCYYPISCLDVPRNPSRRPIVLGPCLVWALSFISTCLGQARRCLNPLIRYLRGVFVKKESAR
jgi:hypothetical protein